MYVDLRNFSLITSQSAYFPGLTSHALLDHGAGQAGAGEEERAAGERGGQERFLLSLPSRLNTSQYNPNLVVSVSYVTCCWSAPGAASREAARE